MLAADFAVQRRKGPPGKAQMLRAERPLRG
ncbi:MAG: hypothetical protein JNM91_07790 [Flavobacteriales bacterium]|nr:hypothetical protein [Flavobacteriales bacterium]